MDADEQKLQKETQFVRRRRDAFDSGNGYTKNCLQRPASLEIRRLSETNPVPLRRKSFFGVEIPKPLNFVVVVAGTTHHGGFVSDPYAMCTNPCDDGSPHLQWEHFRGEYPGQVSREKLDE